MWCTATASSSSHHLNIFLAVLSYVPLSEVISLNVKKKFFWNNLKLRENVQE